MKYELIAVTLFCLLIGGGVLCTVDVTEAKTTGEIIEDMDNLYIAENTMTEDADTPDQGDAVRNVPCPEAGIQVYLSALRTGVAVEDCEWFQIIPGNTEGFIKSEFFLCGDAAEEVIDDYVTKYATVQADRLNIRKEPDISSPRVGYIDNGEKVKILENLGEWLKVQYTDGATGYVAARYVTVSEEFVPAKTLEEEARE